jgi:hypothetical protein
MNDLRALRLQQATNHIDGRIMPIEEGGGGHEAQRRRGDALTHISPWILDRFPVRLAHGALLIFTGEYITLYP